MNMQEFLKRATDFVRDYTKRKLEVKGDFAVNIVWSCYTLGNMKCLIATYPTHGMYFEITYNRNTDEVYHDVYQYEG